jgi:probable phosphoglycerate mutase
MKIKLTIIRHGETEWNKIGKQQGQLNSDLSENGIKQALAIKNYISDEYSFIISSDLGRAIQTAEIIAERYNYKIFLNPGLRERHLGIIQGLTMNEFKDKYPEEYNNFNSNNPDYIIPGGESAKQRYTRAINALNKIVNENNGKNLLIVTHGGILDSLFRYVLNLPINQKRSFSLINGSINKFSFEKYWMLESWGEISHLKGLNPLDDF